MFTSPRISVGFKRSLALALLIVAVMAGFTAFMTSYLTQRLDSRTEQELSRQVSQLVNSMSSYHAALADSADRLSAVFRTNFPASFKLDHSRSIEINCIQTPVLLNGTTTLNLNNAITDRFTGITRAVASVFVCTGDDFVRIATSLKKEDGSRAVGTVLDRSHPAYCGLLKGETFTGKVTLFGKDYMTRYEPVKDGRGKVIAVLFIGLDFTDSLKALKEKIRATTIARAVIFTPLRHRI